MTWENAEVKAREERRARRKEDHTIENCHTKARNDLESVSDDSDDKQPSQAPNP
jgi:hypothetical protein